MDKNNSKLGYIDIVEMKRFLPQQLYTKFSCVVLQCTNRAIITTKLSKKATSSKHTSAYFVTCTSPTEGLQWRRLDQSKLLDTRKFLATQYLRYQNF